MTKKLDQVGNTLKLLRNYHRLFQNELGQKLHLSHIQISNLESGRTPPSLSTLCAYCELFELDLPSLVWLACNLEGVDINEVSSGNIKLDPKILTIKKWDIQNKW